MTGATNGTGTAAAWAEKGALAARVVVELRALSTVHDRLDGYAARRFGLNRTDLRALDLIGQAGSISPTVLAGRLGMSTGVTSTVLDRLEAAGYATREPDPERRRRTRVRMTEQAARLSQTVFEPVIKGTTESALALPPEVLCQIADFLAGHRMLLEEQLSSGQ
jgi:DNA-binding MarR family transcriptional regulator